MKRYTIDEIYSKQNKKEKNKKNNCYYINNSIINI